MGNLRGVKHAKASRGLCRRASVSRQQFLQRERDAELFRQEQEIEMPATGNAAPTLPHLDGLCGKSEPSGDEFRAPKPANDLGCSVHG